MHQLLLPALSLGLAVGGLGAPAVAQDASPAEGVTFADTLELPELEIVATDDGFEGVPEETEAGRYVVTFRNEQTDEDNASPAVGFVRLPEGRSLANLMPDAPASEEGEVDPAAIGWLYETYVAGGAAAEPGQTGQAIVDLLPGEYVVWADDPASLVGAPTMSVTGEMPGELAEPEADVTVTEVGTAEGYAFEIEGEFLPGRQVVAVVNKSDEPHFMELASLPAPITEDQLMNLMMMEEDGTPPPGLEDFDVEAISLAAYAPAQSAGTTQWLAVDLQEGAHWIACWVPDPANEGMPHAMEGMLDLVTVGGD